MSIRTLPVVEFLFDQSVNCPADCVGEVGEVKMLPVHIARKLSGRGMGRLTSEIVTEEELAAMPEVPVVCDNICRRLESMGFVRNPRAVKPLQETKDDTGEESDSRPDIQSGDGGKKKSVRHRKRRKSVGASTGKE